MEICSSCWRSLGSRLARFQWTDIEVLKEPSGQPRIRLTGECARIAHDQGIVRWHVSISHIETHATASAIGLRGDD